MPYTLSICIKTNIVHAGYGAGHSADEEGIHALGPQEPCTVVPTGPDLTLSTFWGNMWWPYRQLARLQLLTDQGPVGIARWNCVTAESGWRSDDAEDPEKKTQEACRADCSQPDSSRPEPFHAAICHDERHGRGILSR